MVSCPHNKKPDRAIVEELIAIEKEAGFPSAARGLLVAAACQESGIRPNPGKGDGGMSIGMFQFAGWAKKSIRKYATPGHKGDIRLDWRASARFWSRHVARQYGRVYKHCKGYRGYRSKLAMRWASANATAVRYPLCARRRLDGRCIAWSPRCSKRGTGKETLHWRTRARWARKVHQQLKAQAVEAETLNQQKAKKKTEADAAIKKADDMAAQPKPSEPDA